MEVSIKESDLLKVVSDWLSWKHIVHWRQNSGAVIETYTEKGGKQKKRFIRFVRLLYPNPKVDNLKMPDLAGVYLGFYFTIELKNPKRYRNDEGQNNFLKLIRKNGGFAIKAKKLEDVQIMIKEIEEIVSILNRFDLKISKS